MTLDVVRGIAILLVVMFHLQVTTGLAAIDRAAVPVLSAGWAGVDLFFVLSGFLVGRMILVAAASPAGLDRARFLRRRMLRLWPVLFLYLAMLVATCGMAGVAMVWPVLLHVQNYAHGIPSHLWSLGVEEQFYLIAAIGLPPVLRRYGARRLGGVLVAVLVGSTILRLGAWQAGVAPQHLQWQTQYRADAIVLGILMAWAELYRPDWLARAVRRRPLNLAIAVGGYALLATAPTDDLRFGPGLIAADLASAALLLAFLGATIPRGMAGVARPVAALGGIAYPLYIWHASIAKVADGIAPALGMGAPLPSMILRYGASVAVATMIAVLVERPMMRLRDRSLRSEALSVAIAGSY